MLGVVMAGGDSRRLGTDKALVAFDGEPMWQRQARVLTAAGATRTVLIRRPDQSSPAEIECWHDQHRGVGPLAGLHAALTPQAASHVMVLAVDMPGITAAWFQILRAQCRPGVGAMIRHGEACEPLAAIYPTEALAEVQARLQRGEHSLQRLAAALAERGQMIFLAADASAPTALRGINTPEELATWRARERRVKFKESEMLAHSASHV